MNYDATTFRRLDPRQVPHIFIQREQAMRDGVLALDCCPAEIRGDPDYPWGMATRL